MDYPNHKNALANQHRHGAGIGVSAAAMRDGPTPARKPRLEAAADHLEYLTEEIGALCLAAHSNVDRLGGPVPSEPGPVGANAGPAISQIARIESRVSQLTLAACQMRAIIARLEQL